MCRYLLFMCELYVMYVLLCVLYARLQNHTVKQSRLFKLRIIWLQSHLENYPNRITQQVSP